MSATPEFHARFTGALYAVLVDLTGTPFVDEDVPSFALDPTRDFDLAARHWGDEHAGGRTAWVIEIDTGRDITDRAATRYLQMRGVAA